MSEEEEEGDSLTPVPSSLSHALEELPDVSVSQDYLHSPPLSSFSEEHPEPSDWDPLTLDSPEEEEAAFLGLSDTPATSLSFVGHKVWFDESSKSLILHRRNEYRVVSLESEARLWSRFKSPHATAPAADVKISPCGAWVALQLDERNVLLLNPLKNQSLRLECSGQRADPNKNPSANAVLHGGVVWLPSSNETARVLLVTRNGLESYAFSLLHAPKLLCTGLTSHPEIQSFWFLPRLGVLAVCSGREVLGYRLDPLSTPKKLRKLTLDRSPIPGQIALVELYEEAWLVQIRSRGIALHALSGANRASRRKRFQFMLRPSVAPPNVCGVSSVSSLLLIHLREPMGCTLVIDAMDEDRVYRVDTALQSERDDEEEAEEEGSGRCGGPLARPLRLQGPAPVFENTAGGVYGTSTMFLPPHFLLHARAGTVWRVELSLDLLSKWSLRSPSSEYESIAPSISRVAEYLLRRGLEGKEVFLRRLRERVMSKTLTSEELRQWFHGANQRRRVSRAARRLEEQEEALSASLAEEDPTKLSELCEAHCVAVTQRDVYLRVWSIAFAEFQSRQEDVTYLADLLWDYAAQQDVASKRYLHALLARALGVAKRFTELNQLVMFRATGDDEELARLLLSKDNVSHGHQLGIDMLWRLKAYDAVFLALLERGGAIKAFALMREGRVESTSERRRRLLETCAEDPDLARRMGELLGGTE